MKFGICLPNNFILPESPAQEDSLTVQALVDGYRFIQTVGYDYIEYAASHFASLSDEDMKKAVTYYKEGLLKVEACNGFIPGTMPLVGSGADLNTVTSYLNAVIPRMASVGVQTVVFGSGTARRIPDGVSCEQAQQQLDEFLLLAESIAREYGITIAMEPLNHKETNVFLTVTESAKTIRRLHLPNLKVLADLYHTYVEQEDPMVLIENSDLLCHIHVADPEARTIPVDHSYLRACGKALKKSGYHGRISIECSCKDFASEVSNALPLLKKLF